MKNQQKNPKKNTNNILVLMPGSSISNSFEKIMDLANGNSKICYVCLSKPYNSVVEKLQELKMNHKNIVFIDAVSKVSALSGSMPANNCILVSGLEDIQEISSKIIETIEIQGCNRIIFDSLTALLSFQETESILKLANDLIKSDSQEQVTKFFAISKKSEFYSDQNTRLIKDLFLFADKLIDLA